MSKITRRRMKIYEKDTLVAAAKMLRESGALYEYAMTLLKEPAAIFKDDPVIWNELGVNLWMTGNIPGAVDAFNVALDLAPNNRTVLNNAGTMMRDVNAFDAGEAMLRQVLKDNPKDPVASYNLALLLLIQGKFEEAWPLFKLRTEYERYNKTASPHDFPEWDGQSEGKVVILGEQDLGEKILFTSVIPEIAARGDLVLESPPRLEKILSRSFPDVEVAAGKEVKGIKWKILMADLIAMRRKRFEDFPKYPHGYLKADPEKTASHRKTFDWSGDGALIVGVSWCSRNAHLGRHKSTSVDDLRPLFDAHDDVWFMDCQYGSDSYERNYTPEDENVNGITLMSPLQSFTSDDFTGDLDNMAAYLSACDLVITVSNTTAHLAAALGVPTWVLIPAGTGRVWYWFAEGENSPWYPNVKLYRQDTAGDWSGPISRMMEDLGAVKEAHERKKAS